MKLRLGQIVGPNTRNKVDDLSVMKVRRVDFGKCVEWYVSSVSPTIVP